MTRPAERPTDDDPCPAHGDPTTLPTDQNDGGTLMHELGNALMIAQMGVAALLRQGLIAAEGQETGGAILEALEKALGLFREIKLTPPRQ